MNTYREILVWVLFFLVCRDVVGADFGCRFASQPIRLQVFSPHLAVSSLVHVRVFLASTPTAIHLESLRLCLTIFHRLLRRHDPSPKPHAHSPSPPIYRHRARSPEIVRLQISPRHHAETGGRMGREGNIPRRERRQRSSVVCAGDERQDPRVPSTFHRNSVQGRSRREHPQVVCYGTPGASGLRNYFFLLSLRRFAAASRRSTLN